LGGWAAALILCRQGTLRALSDLLAMVRQPSSYQDQMIAVATSEPDAIPAQVRQQLEVEEYRASELHSAKLRKHVMGLIDASRACLPGVDVPRA